VERLQRVRWNVSKECGGTSPKSAVERLQRVWKVLIDVSTSIIDHGSIHLLDLHSYNDGLDLPILWAHAMRPYDFWTES